MDYAGTRQHCSLCNRQCQFTVTAGYRNETVRCYVAMLAAVNSNQRHNPETGFLEFLPDTPRWVRDLDAAMFHFAADGIFAKMDDRYQAGKAALAQHFDVGFMP